MGGGGCGHLSTPWSLPLGSCPGRRRAPPALPVRQCQWRGCRAYGEGAVCPPTHPRPASLQELPLYEPRGRALLSSGRRGGRPRPAPPRGLARGGAGGLGAPGAAPARSGGRRGRPGPPGPRRHPPRPEAAGQAATRPAPPAPAAGGEQRRGARKRRARGRAAGAEGAGAGPAAPGAPPLAARRLGAAAQRAAGLGKGACCASRAGSISPPAPALSR